jgi:hypothetical protein
VSEKAPQQAFCMTCGPDVVVERVDGAVLRCPSCGDEQRIPALPLFVVTGASGTGKSTVMEPLRARLPDVEVFDVDVTLQVAALGWDTWLRANIRPCLDTNGLTPDQTADRIASWISGTCTPRP